MSLIEEEKRESSSRADFKTKAHFFLQILEFNIVRIYDHDKLSMIRIDIIWTGIGETNWLYGIVCIILYLFCLIRTAYFSLLLLMYARQESDNSGKYTFPDI